MPGLIKLYYILKPVIPRSLQIFMRRVRFHTKRRMYKNLWPIKEESGHLPADWKGWPENKKFALVLTHDVESAAGCEKCIDLMNLEKDLG